MKCPYCHIHYMDDERECPICGEHNPNFRLGFGKSKQTAKKQPAEYPSHKPIQQSSKSAKKREKTQKQSGTWSKILAVLLVIIPLMGNIVFDNIDDITKSTEEAVNINLLQPPESAYATLDGVWKCEETGEELSFSVGELEYTLETPQSVEQGQMEIVEESVEQDDNGRELYFYEVKFYSDEGYNDTWVVMGTQNSQFIVTMPADEAESNTDNMQAWERSDNSNV